MKPGRPHISRHLGPLLALAILLSFLPFLAQANAAPPESPPGLDELHVGQQDDGRRYELSEGQILVVNLDGNPSTGYGWVVEEPEKLKLQPVGQTQFESESDLIGAPGKLVQRFRAVEAGTSTLSLAYRRPWEDTAPLDTFSVVVEGVGTFAETPPPSQAFDSEPVPLPKAARPIITGEQPEQTPPATYNWCDLGGCTPVRNQGSCGACWAFGTVGVLELQIKRNDGVTRDLSEQYLVSCNTNDWGCGGGWWAHDYHLDAVPPGEPDAGAVNESEFPYVASDVSCNPPHEHYEKITSWHYVGASSGVPSIADIKQAIYDHGPLAVAICVGSAFQGYGGGVFTTDESYLCDTVNHGVVLVGWDDGQGIWHLRNSWGAGWGESGYMRIGYGVSRVGYGASYVTYVGGSPGPLVYSGHTVDDDNNDQSSGNGDGQVDCGETIELLVDLYNQGSSTAVGVNAILSTSSPYVTITDDDEDWPDIPGSGTRTNIYDYDLSVDPSTPNGHVIQFDLDITASNGGPWSDSFDVPVSCVNGPPAAPNPLQATGVSQSQIDVWWTDNSSDETGFRIERSPNGSSSWTTIATVGANVSTYPNTSLPQDTNFYYRVCAYNDNGDSDYTNVARPKPSGTWSRAVYLPIIVRGTRLTATTVCPSTPALSLVRCHHPAGASSKPIPARPGRSGRAFGI